MKSTIITSAIILISASAIGQITLTGESFSRIKIEGNAKVSARQDSVSYVRFSGNDNPSRSEVNISNGTLIIDGIPSNELIVGLPKLEEIKIDGNGTVSGSGTFNSDNLKLDIDGNGKITLDVISKNVDAKISGLGKITLTGTAENSTLSIPGSGKIDAIGMKTIRSNVDISGLGKCNVDVIDELNTKIEGSGSVAYKSEPKKINNNITGIGNVKNYSGSAGSDNEAPEYSSSDTTRSDTTRLEFGENQLWIIGKKTHSKCGLQKTKPIWAGLELGYNSYLDNGGNFTLSPGKENFELRTEKSIYVALNLVQHQVELGKSNVWFFTGLGISWNNYRFDNDIIIDNGDYITAHHDSTPGIVNIKSKLTCSYLNVPIMFEVFTSRNIKKAVHIGAGGMFGLRIETHTKRKFDLDGKTTKTHSYDNFNVNPFRYGFRVAVGYGKFNLFADYYASTLFKDNKGPVLYPVNAGITFVGF